MHSIIDYCLISSNLYKRLGHIEIDEEGTKSLESDHNQIKMKFGAAEPEKQLQKRESELTLKNAQLHEISERIETLVSRQLE